MTTLQKLKLLLELTDNEQDEKLTLYLEIAKTSILTRLYPYANDDEEKEVPKKYINLQTQIAQYLYLKEGAEGETAHNENGVNRIYDSSDIPARLLSQIVPYCGGLK